VQIANLGRTLAGEPLLAPKRGARFHFELPGSVQGFRVEPADAGAIENLGGHSDLGRRTLALRMAAGDVRLVTPTFTPPDARRCTEEGLITAPWLHPGNYALLASPTLYPGQVVGARLVADPANAAPVHCRLIARCYGAGDELTTTLAGPESELAPGADGLLRWRVEDTGGQPIAEVGVEVRGEDAVVRLDHLGWDGAPDVTFARPDSGGTMWRRAWVPGVERFEPAAASAFQLVQNRGRGLLIQGTREWKDYEVTSTVAPQTITAAAGIAARTQGLRRFYALLLCADDTVQLVKALDGDTVLARAPFARTPDAAYELRLRVEGGGLEGRVDGELIVAAEDRDRPLTGGGVAFVCEAGSLTSDAISVRGVTP
jgi:hypothetical protein